MALMASILRESLRPLWHRYLAMRLTDVRYPTYPERVQKMISNLSDRTRYRAMALALATVEREAVPGALAELGVYRRTTSQFLHNFMPHRSIYLFDSFCGFGRDGDVRFRDTSVQLVRRRVGNGPNVHIRVGYFPETASGLEGEEFAFVLIDMDKYEPTLAALEFFYPRMPPGAYCFLHDYNNLESGRGVFRAATEFMAGKPEFVVELPDVWGSAAFRRSRVVRA